MARPKEWNWAVEEDVVDKNRTQGKTYDLQMRPNKTDTKQKEKTENERDPGKRIGENNESATGHQRG